MLITTAFPAHAAPYDDLFVFGDSYSDTGSFVQLSNGPTAVGVLAQKLGITLLTSQVAIPGTNGVNFAESGARIATPTTADIGNGQVFQVQSLAQQVQMFQDDVTNRRLSFNPDTTLFFLAGGLNDHAPAPAEFQTIYASYVQQIVTLIGLGAKHIEVALLPDLGRPFSDSAAAFNPAFSIMVPFIETVYESTGVQISLSNWGGFYEQVLQNPAQYGITNTTDPCIDLTQANPSVCANPDSYFYYYNFHPSAAVSDIVGQQLYLEAVPEPAGWPIYAAGAGMLGLAARSRRRR